MKFSELSKGDKFTHADYKNKVFIKVKHKGATCCTKEHNAKRKGSVYLFDKNDDVEKAE